MSFVRNVLSNKNKLLSDISNRLFRYSPRQCSTRNIEANTGPIKFTKSPASKWQAASSRRGYSEARLWYEPHVISVSLSIFMLYFCVLREENDVDKELQKTLYNRIEGLEEKQLEASLEFNKQHGLETEDIINRLQEIRTPEGPEK